MAKRKRPATWAEVGVANAGFRATLHAFHFAMGWGLATAELGREPETVDEYAEVMGLSRAKAFRDQQDWRKAFPEHDTPHAFNVRSGNQAKYDEILRRLGDLGEAKREAEVMVLQIGGTPV